MICFEADPRHAEVSVNELGVSDPKLVTSPVRNDDQEE